MAVTFCGACMAFAVLEATVGVNPISSVLFFVSIPALVTGLLWAHRSLLRSANRYTALATLAVSVFVYASLILLLGLVAAWKLKALLMEV